VVVRGSLDLTALVPATDPADIPLWEAVRVLANGLVEHVKYEEGLLSAERVVAKSYESLVEAYLVRERRHRPTYAERLDQIAGRPPRGVRRRTATRALPRARRPGDQ